MKVLLRLILLTNYLLFINFAQAQDNKWNIADDHGNIKNVDFSSNW